MYYVTGQCLFNVPDVTLVPNFGRILVASLSNVNVASYYGLLDVRCKVLF